MRAADVAASFYDVTLFDCPPFVMFDADDCPRARDIRLHKKFEPMSMKLWCARARTASTIIDVGAQVGVYTLAAAALRSDIPIIAFEPNPDAYARLALHVRINGFANVIARREALADRNGTRFLSWFDKGHISSGATLLREPGLNSAVTVTAVACVFDDTPFSLTPYDALIKIDVEGAEALVLAGMGESLSERRPDIIVETFSQASCDVINPMLAELEYRIYKISEDNMHLERRPRLEPCDPKGNDFNHYLTCNPLPAL